MLVNPFFSAPLRRAGNPPFTFIDVLLSREQKARDHGLRLQVCNDAFKAELQVAETEALLLVVFLTVEAPC